MSKKSSRILAFCAGIALSLGLSTAASAIPVLQQISPNPTTYAFPSDFNLLFGSVPGDVTGILEAVDLTLPPTVVPSSTSGCEAADFAGFVAGRIALLQRGTCGFAEKVANAMAAGAIGALIFNEGNPGRTLSFVGTCDPSCGIPVLSSSFFVGSDLALLSMTTPVTVRIAVSAEDLMANVPEPGTLSILGFGIVALALTRRRVQRRSERPSAGSGLRDTLRVTR